MHLKADLAELWNLIDKRQIALAKTLVKKFILFGIAITVTVTATVTVSAVGLVQSNGSNPIPPVKPGVTQIVPAAPGGQYPVDVFCSDDKTDITRTFAPDSISSVLYTLKRPRSNPTEVITWAPGMLANHTFIDERGQPGGEQVQVSPAAAKCIFDKGGNP